MIVTNGRHLRIPRPAGSSTMRGNDTLASVEKDYITGVLDACNGQIRGKNGAAARLGLTPKKLEALMTKLGIRPRRR
jgi:transcriptional regulator with GAF, ATPase, and Fis domain